MDRYPKPQPPQVTKQEEDKMDLTSVQSYVTDRIQSIKFHLLRQAVDVYPSKQKSIPGIYQVKELKYLYRMEDIREQAAKLERNYKWHITIRGDGNCFYRSIIILYICRLFESTDLLLNFIYQVYNLKNIQSSLTNKVNCDDLKAIFLGFLLFLLEVKNEGKVQSFKEVIYFYNELPEVDLAAIVITRFMIYQQFIQMQNDPVQKYFIEERIWKEGKALILTYYVCAEDVIIPLAASALNCKINIQHFYRSNHDKRNPGFVNKIEQYNPKLQNPSTNVSVLFLEGHYEALLGHISHPFYELNSYNEQVVKDIVSSKVFFDFFNSAPPVAQRTAKANLNVNTNINTRAQSAYTKQPSGFKDSKIIKNDILKQSESQFKEVFSPKVLKEIPNFNSNENPPLLISKNTQENMDQQAKQKNQSQIQKSNKELENIKIGQQNNEKNKQKLENFSSKITEVNESQVNSNVKQSEIKKPKDLNSVVILEEKPTRDINLKKQLSPRNQITEQFDCFICAYKANNQLIPIKNTIMNVCGQCVMLINQNVITQDKQLNRNEKNQQIKDPIQDTIKLENGKGKSDKNILNNEKSSSIKIIQHNPNQSSKEIGLDKAPPSQTTIKDQKATPQQVNNKNITNIQILNDNPNPVDQQIHQRTLYKVESLKKVPENVLAQTELFLKGLNNCLYCKCDVNEYNYCLREEKGVKSFGICQNCILVRLSFEEIQGKNKVTLNSKVFLVPDIIIKSIQKNKDLTKQAEQRNEEKKLIQQNREKLNSRKEEIDNIMQEKNIKINPSNKQERPQSGNHLSINQLVEKKQNKQEDHFIITDFMNQEICICCKQNKNSYGKLFDISYILATRRLLSVYICQICLCEQEINSYNEFQFKNSKFMVPQPLREQIRKLKEQQEKQFNSRSEERQYSLKSANNPNRKYQYQDSSNSIALQSSPKTYQQQIQPLPQQQNYFSQNIQYRKYDHSIDSYQLRQKQLEYEYNRKSNYQQYYNYYPNR